MSIRVVAEKRADMKKRKEYKAQTPSPAHGECVSATLLPRNPRQCAQSQDQRFVAHSGVTDGTGRQKRCSTKCPRVGTRSKIQNEDGHTRAQQDRKDHCGFSVREGNSIFL